MTQTHCGEAEFVNHRIVRWAPGATPFSVAAGKEVEGVVTGDGVDGPVHEVTVERYVLTASRLPPSHLLPFDSRGLWTKRGHTRARHRCPQPPTLVSPCTNPSLPCFSFSSSSSTFSLFQQSLNFVPTEFHAALRKAWGGANALW